MRDEEKKSIGRTLIDLIESLEMIDEDVYGSSMVAGAELRQVQIEKIIIKEFGLVEYASEK